MGFEKCKCGVGDVFYSHLHEKGCPCADDPAMKAPQDPKDKRIEELERELANRPQRSRAHLCEKGHRARYVCRRMAVG